MNPHRHMQKLFPIGKERRKATVVQNKGKHLPQVKTVLTIASKLYKREVPYLQKFFSFFVSTNSSKKL